MAENFYKVKLKDGRVIGPLDMERIRLFVIHDKITGLETARYYPTGEWKDINTFSEIADLLLLKIEGKLSKEDTSFTELPPDPPISIEEEPNIKSSEPIVSPDDDKTIVVTRDNEKTTVDIKKNETKKINLDFDRASLLEDVQPVVLQGADEESELVNVDKKIFTEPTKMLERKSKSGGKKSVNKKRQFLVAAGIAISFALVFFNEDKKSKKKEIPFRIEMPAPSEMADYQTSEKAFQEGLKFYVQDTISGYKQAANKFLKAANSDANNIRAICMLASSYMNLIDVVKRDENYFNVITRLIELGRSRGVDLAETVIADVELYQTLSNPEAALNRIVEFSKTHPQFGAEMYYYLAHSFFLKGKSGDSLRYLGNIDPKGYYSAKIPYLYGLIYRRAAETEKAKQSFELALQMSPMHIKSQIALTEIYYSNDNLPAASKLIDSILANKDEATTPEIARAYYFRSKVRLVAGKEEEALKDLENAQQLVANDPDITLDYYTLKSRLGSKVKEAQAKAKMFHYLAEGEKALRSSNLKSALNNFMDAREAERTDALPLVKIADVFVKKGDFQAAKSNYEKAVALKPKNKDVYPDFIRTLINAYEFEEANRVLNNFKELNPSVHVVDQLQGDIFYGIERYPEALAFYKRALSANNVDSSIYISFANAMFKTNGFKDSAFFYGLGQRFDPLNVDATIGIGKSLSEIDSLEKGVEYVQNALQGSSEKAVLLNGIAEIYLRKGDYPTALKFASNAIAADENNVKAYRTKGDIFSAQEKLKDALDSYQTYINLKPLDPAGYIGKYRVFMKKMDLKGAKDTMETLMRLYPKYPGVYYMIGEVYKEGQNFESAMKAGIEEIKVNPTYLPAYALASQGANKIGEFSQGLEISSRGLKLNPTYVPLLIQAGVANHFLKSYVASQALLDRALALDKGNPEIHKRLGLLFNDLGNREKANQHLKAYIDLYPNAPDRGEVEGLMK